jgi:hypothetical protein
MEEEKEDKPEMETKVEEKKERHYGLRPKKESSLLDYFKKIDEEIGYESSSSSQSESKKGKKRRRKRKEEDTDFTDI